MCLLHTGPLVALFSILQTSVRAVLGAYFILGLIGSGSGFCLFISIYM